MPYIYHCYLFYYSCAYTVGCCICSFFFILSSSEDNYRIERTIKDQDIDEKEKKQFEKIVQWFKDRTEYSR